MKRWLVMALVFELFIAAVLSQVGFLRRQDFDRAFVAWRQSATPRSKSRTGSEEAFERLGKVGVFDHRIRGHGSCHPARILWL